MRHFYFGKSLPPLSGAIFFLVMVTARGWSAPPREYHLLEAHIDQRSTIEEQLLIYDLDLMFDAAPEHFWAYYDDESAVMVIDVYGAKIHMDHPLDLGRGLLFKNVDVINRKTSFSLSRSQSLIYIAVDEGWHYQYAEQNDSTIRITGIKKFSVPKPIGNTKRRSALYISLAIAFCTLTFGGLTFTLNDLLSK